MPDLYMVLYEFEHINSGAKFVYLQRNHRHNGFCITFLTPPQDDTGLPHILEHSVLDGSRKYPALGSYFELAKGSATDNTLASTSQVSTFYEACSYIPADIFNFADFYIDSALNPLLSKQTFSREAWHYIVKEDATSSPSLAIEGIVFNEMKLSESSIDRILAKFTFQHILPNSPYQWNSGGATEQIPNLNYQQFLDFHKKWYIPENSLLMAFGDTDPESWLDFLSSRLPSYQAETVSKNIKRREEAIDSMFINLPEWTKPKEYIIPYAIENDDTDGKTYHRFTWLIPNTLTCDRVSIFEIVSRLVINKINTCPDLHNGRYGTYLEGYSGISCMDDRFLFSICFQNSEVKHKSKLRSSVLKFLRDIEKTGFEPYEVDQVFYQMKMSAVKNLTEPAPSFYFDHIRRSWIKNVDIVKHLRAMMSPKQIDEIHGQWEKKPTLFTELLKTTITDNMHRLDIMAIPDPELSSKNNQRLVAQLASAEKLLSEADYNKIRARCSSGSNIAEQKPSLSVPQLQLKDLPLRASYLPYTEDILQSGAAFLRTDISTASMNYMSIVIDLDGLDESLQPFIPIYCHVINNGWTNGNNFELNPNNKFSISCSSCFFTNPGVPSKTEKKIVLLASWMDSDTAKVLDVITDCMFCLDALDNETKDQNSDWLIDILMTQYSAHLDKIQNPDVDFVLCHLRSMINESGYLNNLSSGLPLLTMYSEGICEDPESVLEELLGLLKQIDCFIKSHRNWIVSVAGSDPSIETVKSRIDSLVNAFGTTHPTNVPLELISYFVPQQIGFSAPSAIGSCAMVFETPPLTPVEYAVLFLGLKIITENYLIKELRQVYEHVYNASCEYKDQTIALLTTADSRIEHTLEIFRGTLDYIKTSNWTEAEIQRFAINTIKDYVTECRPSKAAGFIMYNYLVKCSESCCQSQYEKLLAITASEVKSVLLKAFSPKFDTAVIGVLANQRELDRLNRAVFKDQLSINVLPI